MSNPIGPEYDIIGCGCAILVWAFFGAVVVGAWNFAMLVIG